MQSSASTVEAYLAELPADRRAALEAVRSLLRANLDPGFEEVMQYGMITYVVPHRTYPAGYHCDPMQPLPLLSLASQKQHMAVYLMHLYMDSKRLKKFEQAWAKSGKKLDMGKSCLRFKKVDDLATDILADTLADVTVGDYVALYESIRPAQKSARKTAAAASSPKKTPPNAKDAKAAASKASARLPKGGKASAPKSRRRAT
jgi:hypothetical protein